MTETEDAPAAPAPPPPKRGRTFLGRLGAALRRQDWAAVGVEVAVVVIGVVIGFQVTAWGQSRADRQREQGYLHQLAADLAETERIVADRDARMDSTTYVGLARLVNAYGMPDRSPRDSVLAWLGDIHYLPTPRPILGTAEAIVSSGDFGAIRDDSLRAAILRYLDLNRERMDDQARFWSLAHADLRALGQVSNLLPSTEVTFDLREADVLGAFDTDPDTTGRAASRDWRDPFPPDWDAVLDDPAFYRTLSSLSVYVRELQNTRRVFAESAAGLREQVEAQIDD